MKTFLTISMIVLFAIPAAKAQNDFKKDVIETSVGNLEITFIGHGTLMFKINDLVIHVDPVTRYADYSKLPKAGIVLITHQHGDHLSQEALDLISISNTDIVVTEKIFEEINKGIVMNNWDTKEFKGLEILAVPAYNLVHTRNDGSPFHPKGEGNGYVMTLGDKKVYIGGDTENFPEMKEIPHIDIAFLPMNLPYTMTPEMVADAAIMLQPQILYPYHYGDTDPYVLNELIKKEKNIQIRIRDLK